MKIEVGKINRSACAQCTTQTLCKAAQQLVQLRMRTGDANGTPPKNRQRHNTDKTPNKRPRFQGSRALMVGGDKRLIERAIARMPDPITVPREQCRISVRSTGCQQNFAGQLGLLGGAGCLEWEQQAPLRPPSGRCRPIDIPGSRSMRPLRLRTMPWGPIWPVGRQVSPDQTLQQVLRPPDARCALFDTKFGRTNLRRWPGLPRGVRNRRSTDS